MALKIMEKIKEQIPTAESVTELEHAELVEEYVTWVDKLNALNEELSPIAKHVKLLKTSLQEAADNMREPEEKGEIEGLLHDIEFGPKAKSVTYIDKDALLVALGSDTYIELAKVGVGDIRAYTNPKEQEKILTEERNGARSIKAVKKA